MTREEAISTLRNTAWLGTDGDRNNVEEAIEILTTDKGGETIYRQDAIEAIKNLPRWIMDSNGEFQPVDPPTVSMLDPEDAVSAIENLPSAQLELLTDKEQRIFLAAMGREEKVCEEVDRNYVRESYEDSLMRVCKEIRRKVKGALWT